MLDPTRLWAGVLPAHVVAPTFVAFEPGKLVFRVPDGGDVGDYTGQQTRDALAAALPHLVVHGVTSPVGDSTRSLMVLLVGDHPDPLEVRHANVATAFRRVGLPYPFPVGLEPLVVGVGAGRVLGVVGLLGVVLGVSVGVVARGCGCELVLGCSVAA